MVKGSNNHRQTGSREVNVDALLSKDDRYADLTFAVDNAFKRARRQLQDQARRIRGDTKHHEGQPIGTIVRIDPSSEFGFLRAFDGHEIYFNSNSSVDRPPPDPVRVKLEVVSAAPLLAETIRRLHENEGVADLLRYQA